MNGRCFPLGSWGLQSPCGGDDPPCVLVEVLLELTKGLGPLAGTTMAMMVSMQLHHDVMLGITYIDMMTCSMSLVSLGATPFTVDHPMPTLEEVGRHGF